MGKLTPKMTEALTMLSSGPNSAYTMGVSLGTLEAMSKRGLVSKIHAIGNMAWPRIAKWQITDDGRAALKETLG